MLAACPLLSFISSLCRSFESVVKRLSEHSDRVWTVDFMGLLTTTCGDRCQRYLLLVFPDLALAPCPWVQRQHQRNHNIHVGIYRGVPYPFQHTRYQPRP